MIARLKLERQRTHCVEVTLQIKTNKTQFHRCPFAIATSTKTIVFICLDEKTAGRCAPASRKISYYDGLHFADAKDREQPLPPTAVVGFKSAGAAKDRSLAANIDADRALISFKEIPITQMEASHDALKVAREEIGRLAVEQAPS